MFMLAVGPWGETTGDFREFLDLCAVSMCKAVCAGQSAEDASLHESVVKAAVRRTRREPRRRLPAPRRLSWQRIRRRLHTGTAQRFDYSCFCARVSR